MKVLVFGANGWIGQKFVKILVNSGIDYVPSKCRADNEDEIIRELEEQKPTHVCSFIGRTHGTYEGVKIPTIDYLEKPGMLVKNVNDNLFSILLLTKLCKDKGVHFTYLGTGCIFDYDEEHPFGEEVNGFSEKSLPNFFGSSYSIVKGFTDRLMKLYGDSALTVRIRMPITDEFNERNFITKITNYQKVCSIPNSMTVLNELLPILLKMMKDNLTGTVNFTNPGLISHNEILEMYKEIVDPEFTWNNFTIEEQNEVLASKRSNNFLDTTRLETYCPEVMNIKESVRKMLVDMKANKDANV